MQNPYKVEERDLGNGQVGLRVTGPGISEYWATSQIQADAAIVQHFLAYKAGYAAALFASQPNVSRVRSKVGRRRLPN